MNLASRVFVQAALFFAVIDDVNSHGRMVEPPSRASMGKLGYPHNPINYDDNGVNCGGYKRQWEDNVGKCGVCGDPWDGAREHEAGGKFANGIVVRHYTAGDSITIRVEVTAPHRGYFRFQICPYIDPTVPTKENCFEDLPLVIDNKTSTERYVLPVSPNHATGFHDITVKLPINVDNSRAVIRWIWRTGNSWGEGELKSGLGLGNQEHFYACADVAIGTPPGVNLADIQKANLAGDSESLTISPPPSSKKHPDSLLSKCQAGTMYKVNPAIIDWCRSTCILSTTYCREAINTGQCSEDCILAKDKYSTQSGQTNSTPPKELIGATHPDKLSANETPGIKDISKTDTVGQAVQLTTLLSSVQSTTVKSRDISTLAPKLQSSTKKKSVRFCEAGLRFRREKCLRTWCRKTCRRTQKTCEEAVYLGICSRKCL